MCFRKSPTEVKVQISEELAPDESHFLFRRKHIKKEPAPIHLAEDKTDWFDKYGVITTTEEDLSVLHFGPDFNLWQLDLLFEHIGALKSSQVTHLICELPLNRMLGDAKVFHNMRYAPSVNYLLYSTRLNSRKPTWISVIKKGRLGRPATPYASSLEIGIEAAIAACKNRQSTFPVHNGNIRGARGIKMNKRGLQQPQLKSDVAESSYYYEPLRAQVLSDDEG